MDQVKNPWPSRHFWKWTGGRKFKNDAIDNLNSILASIIRTTPFAVSATHGAKRLMPLFGTDVSDTNGHLFIVVSQLVIICMAIRLGRDNETWSSWVLCSRRLQSDSRDSWGFFVCLLSIQTLGPTSCLHCSTPPVDYFSSNQASTSCPSTRLTMMERKQTQRKQPTIKTWINFN